MKRAIALTLAIALGATATYAQQGNPGGHFVENWDLDDDGQVTLAEATERRGDIFYTFDENEDGILQPAEHDAFDAARAADMAENGMGHGKGKMNPANGMLRKFTDANGDGNVTREEFMAAVPAWYERMDRNGNGTVTTADFGKGH